jgi:hypothetical protein
MMLKITGQTEKKLREILNAGRNEVITAHFDDDEWSSHGGGRTSEVFRLSFYIKRTPKEMDNA